MAETLHDRFASFRVQPQPILLAGPTASGKSEAALALAERLGGEIISVDSMQVYRGLDIGTAKPSPQERRRVPHHLLDVVEVTEPFDAAQFARLAHAAVQDIQARGRAPILCGGTGFYFKAFLEGLGEAPPTDATLRAELKRLPMTELLEELRVKDPVLFARIDRDNPRRVIRAVEVVRLTGRPFSEQRATQTVFEQRIASRFIGVRQAPEELRARIDRRVDEMFRRGLVEETRRLLEQGLAQNQTAMQALGYRQVIEHLRGERSLDETIARIKTKTRQYAKRQMTWFRHQLPLKWIDAAVTDTAEEMAKTIIRSL